jgi:hypothetical protein
LRVRALVCVRWPGTGKAAPMPLPAIRLDVDEPLDVHRGVLAEIAFHIALLFDHLADAIDLVLAQILDLLERIDIALPRIFSARELPIPKMYVSPIRACLLRGRSTPAIRAIPCPSSCPGQLPGAVIPAESRTGVLRAWVHLGVHRKP